MLTLLDPICHFDKEKIEKISAFSLKNGGGIGWCYHFDYFFTSTCFAYVHPLLSKNPKILDVGCGPGAIHGYLESKYNVSIIGIDMAYWEKSYIDVKGDIGSEDFRKENGFLDNSFDLIISVSALEHTEKKNHKRTINVCKNLLKKGGYLIITSSLSNEKNNLFDQQWNLSIEEIEEMYEEKLQGNFNDVMTRWKNHKYTVERSIERYGKETFPFLNFGFFYKKD